MKKNILLLLFFISKICYGQDTLTTQNIFMYKNNVQIELLGAGGIYSICYERILINKHKFKTAVESGYSVFKNKNWFGIILPTSITEIYSINKHHIELGIGASPNYVSHVDHGKSWEVLFNGRIGYRYQKPTERFIFRAAFIPVFDKTGAIFWGGISFGYSF